MTVMAPTNQLIDINYFTFTSMHVLITELLLDNFSMLKATVKEFPTLEGKSVSYAVLQYLVISINPPYTHPHAVKIFFVIQGSLKVGFIETTNKLFYSDAATRRYFCVYEKTHAFQV
ncbi:hypothetical protein ACFE04_029575 [Oxalis oulophora]